MSSFEGTFILQLLQRVDATDPDYSSEEAQWSTDTVLATAPILVGKLLAVKKQLKEENNFIEDKIQREINIHAMSVLSAIVWAEIKSLLQYGNNSCQLRVRSNGMIVRKKPHDPRHFPR